MATPSNRPESFDFHFFGLQISSKNAGPNSTLQLAMLLVFFLILFIIWKPLGLGILLTRSAQQLPSKARAIWDKVSSKKRKDEAR